MLTLRELISRCLSKDKTAWSEFVARFKVLVEDSVRHGLRRHNFPYTAEDVKDITQTVFLGIWESEKLSLLREDDKIQSWLVIVAQNSAVDFIRSAKRFLRHKPIYGEADEDLENKAIYNSDPFKELANSEISQAVERIMKTLIARDRLILKLRLAQELSYAEIARISRIPINTVSIVIWRGMAKMRTALKRSGFGSD